MSTILKSAAAALGTLALAGAFATAAIAQDDAPPPPGPPQGQKGPPRARPAPQPYNPEPAITASFEGRSASFTGLIDQSSGQMCYLLNVAGIAGATGAKIVAGQPGKPGQAVVNLQPPVDGASGTCAPVDAATAKALIDQPERYYLEVDNATYPQGAAMAPLHAQIYG